MTRAAHAGRTVAARPVETRAAGGARSVPMTVLAAALASAIVVGVAGGAATVVHAAERHPEPRTVPGSWQLDFTWEKPRAIVLEDGDGAYRWYWYMPYTVVNNSGRTVLFIPEITIATDTGQTIDAGANIPAGLFPLIEQELGNPFLESPIEVVGELLEGEDYARESVAVWPAFEENVTELTIFVAGISGETATVRNPVTDEMVMMRRTLMLRFRLPGDPPSPQRQAVLFEDSREVMR